MPASGSASKVSPEDAWAALSEVERTALQVSYARWLGSAILKRPGTDEPYYEDPYSVDIVAAYIPDKVQEELRGLFNPHPIETTTDSSTTLGGFSAPTTGPLSSRAAFMAVRTAALDDMISEQLAANPRMTQVVILGAGMDTRPYRLSCWHPDTSLFEVDTPSSSAFKQQIMEGSRPSCSRLAAVAADARRLPVLEQQLAAAGFIAAPSPVPAAGCSSSSPPAAASGSSGSAPASGDTGTVVTGGPAGGSEAHPPATLWLLEGFIGYIPREDGARLLRWMAQVSAPGSVLLMTAPPSPREQQDLDQEMQRLGEQGRLEQGYTAMKLHHALFEEVEDTAARVEVAGWRLVQLARGEEIAVKYGALKGQHIMRGRRE